MGTIKVLSEETIDKIAAGEVVERPASVVKELVENSIDSGATAVTVEIKEGGISFIRVTDNGSGIPKNQVKTAFLRHATSKIDDASDIPHISSLGFRGEALSSIAAVAQVELMTKTKEDLIGTRYIIEGAKEKEFCDIGIPGGTTMIVRNIFFNTPARRKFLKSAQTEGSYIEEICVHLAMARPDISIKFISGGQIKFQTSGRGDMKELIYRIYGKDTAREIIPIDVETKEISIKGYLGRPSLNRSTRNFENYFVNGRYVKSKLIATAVEEGYKEYLMQHKFPFFVIEINVASTSIDVNVHPTKMEVRFTNGEELASYIESAVSSTLRVQEMINQVPLYEEKEVKETVHSAPEPFESRRSETLYENTASNIPDSFGLSEEIKKVLGDVKSREAAPAEMPVHKNVIKAENTVIVNTAVQMEMFEDKILSKDTMEDYRIIGQVFETFWLIEYKDKLLMMDQHAAHEKVKYESLIKKLKEKTIDSQVLAPPIVVTLSPAEYQIYSNYKDRFKDLGFELEEFGGEEVAIREIPLDLYGCNAKELFLDILDELAEGKVRDVPEVVNDRIATMACKSAVKGNTVMTEEELMELLRQMLTLDNPYNCPHGRPTIITMTKTEMEKRFKRIVT